MFTVSFFPTEPNNEPWSDESVEYIKKATESPNAE